MKQTMFCYAFLCVFILVPITSAAPQSEGVVGKIKELLAKLTGDGVKASCTSIPSMLEGFIPACLKCEDGTWRIKKRDMIRGKCLKSTKTEKGEGGGGGGSSKDGAVRLGAGNGVCGVLTASLTAILIYGGMR